MKIKIEDKKDIARAVLVQAEENQEEKIKSLIDNGVFKAEAGEILSDTFADPQVIYVGLGKSEKLNSEVLRKAGFALSKEADKLHLKEIALTVPELENMCYVATARDIAEGIIQAGATTDRYKSEKKPAFLETVYLGVEQKEEEIKIAIEEVTNVMYGVATCRRLVNERSNTMTPTTIADDAEKLLTPLGVEVEILDRKKLESLKCHAFLEVARGSDETPKGIVMRWRGNPDDNDTVGLVGKSVTYDSGGYCIKTPQGMADMHGDMGGGAAVIGVMEALARNKVKKNVTAVCFACENLISGHAYKTGDIISSMKGKTIYIGSTDAEGRLTLADALYYIATVEKTSCIIDIATLTGAVIGALGNITTGLITNNNDFSDNLMDVADKMGEPMHRLPLNDDYRDMVKHEVADLTNSTGGKVGAGTITAGAFLENFVENLPWIHLDIAGTSEGKARGYLPQGSHGVPVKSIYYYIANLSSGNDD